VLPQSWAFIVPGILLFVLFILLQLGGGFPRCYSSRHRWKSVSAVHVIWMSALSTVLTTVLARALFSMMSTWNSPSAMWEAFAFGPPLLTGCLSAGVGLLIGMMGSDYEDAAREWISRVGATLGMLSAGWAALFSIAVFVPFWLAQLFELHWAAGTAAVTGWIMTSAGGVLAGNSAKTKGGSDDKPGFSVLKLVVTIAPTVFLVGFLALISFGIHAGLRAFSGQTGVPPDIHEPKIAVKVGTTVEGGRFRDLAVESRVNFTGNDKRPPSWVSVILSNHWKAVDRDLLRRQSEKILREQFGCNWKQMSPYFIGSIALLLFVLSWAVSRRININEFSMHHFYKNRLVRCYLGASHHDRKPNAWTGFDPNDDLKMTEFAAGNSYLGPYPIVNTTVNISRGSELAKQDRKAESFVFTPLYSGFTPMTSKVDLEAREKKENYGAAIGNAVVAAVRSEKKDLQTLKTNAGKSFDETLAPEVYPDGYRLTSEYSGAGGIRLGTAMGISGAAASPNSGYHTSGPLAFLLTVFNVRLGWWLGNPRRDDAAESPGPTFALWPLVSELTGSTDERSRWVNLSDGGHFDNLGLVELVRRRCRYIVIGDGESDKGLNFESLAGAMRKCRADFGVEIDIDLRNLHIVNGLSKLHCAIGRIAYPKQRTGAPEMVGEILYFKSTLTGDEPVDVEQYRSVFSDFPHQSTADQFFSEAQFESYRQLGLHMVRSSLNGVATSSSGSMTTFFDAARRAIGVEGLD